MKPSVVHSFSLFSSPGSNARELINLIMTEELKEVILNNLEFYKKAQAKDFKIQQNLQILFVEVLKITELNSQIEAFAIFYDLDRQTQGNGYRSLVYITECALREIFKICNKVKKKRDNIFFQRSFYEK